MKKNPYQKPQKDFISFDTQLRKLIELPKHQWAIIISIYLQGTIISLQITFPSVSPLGQAGQEF